MKAIVTACGAALLGACALHPAPLGAQADAAPARTEQPMTAGLSAEDAQFVQNATRASLAEAKLGKLAAQRSRFAQVVAFGEQMARHHESMLAELEQLAGKKGLGLPGEPGSEHNRIYDALQALPDAEFDRMYMKLMVEEHAKDIRAFEGRAQDSQDADLKAFATKVLPVLKEHEKLARETRAAVESSGATSVSLMSGSNPER